MSGPVVASAGVISGCMGCMVIVEALAKRQPSAMNLITFSQFLFVALEGLIFTSRFLTVPNRVPLRAYFWVLLTFCFVNVINNQALNYHVPVPLHIIFRSGSLLTSMLMSRFLLGRKQPLKKTLSVLAITLGIIICTLATASTEKKEGALMFENTDKHFNEWIIGMIMLTVALIASSLLAILQEKLYRDHGKHPREAMFYVHALSLPAFALMGADIYKSASEFSRSPPLELGGINFGIPELWIYLMLATVSQWVCIRYVYLAGAEMSAMSVTLLVTLRKFFSLLVSIFYFGNEFTLLHWTGAALVFIGTLVFSDVIRPPLKRREKAE